MKNFWDLTDKEKVALTEEQIDSYIEVALMEEGLIRPKPPELEELREVNPKTTRFWRVKYNGEYSSTELDLCFATEEDARTFIDLKPLKKESPWRIEIPHAKQILDALVFSEDLPTEEEAIRLSSAAACEKEKKERNEEKMKGFEKAKEANEKVVSRLWGARREAQDLEYELKLVMETFNEYKRIAGGDGEIAHNFLLKRYDKEKIEEALKWFEGEVTDESA